MGGFLDQIIQNLRTFLHTEKEKHLEICQMWQKNKTVFFGEYVLLEDLSV